LHEYLLVETIYPEDAYINDEVGEVVVGFRAGKDGFISSVKVLKGVSPSLNAAAVRVVIKMQRWEPGT
jgi:TonB family protein